MNPTISKVDIKGLYNSRNFSVYFDNNSLILVGENGSGKTTISRIIYSVLSCNWDLLNKYPFDAVIIYFDNDEKVEISSSLINSIYSIQDIDRIVNFVELRYSRRRPAGAIISTIFNILKAQNKNDKYFQKNYNIPYEYISDIINSKPVEELYRITEQITRLFPAQILYLPTYRRIEDQLQTIFPEMDSETWEKRKNALSNKRYIELVEFGMNDVKQLVDSEIEMLRRTSQAKQNKLTLGYLGEIVTKNYDKSERYKGIKGLEDKEIREVLSRIDSSILSEESKQLLLQSINEFRESKKRSYSAQVKIICHYFMQLWEFNNQIKKAESNIRSFVETVNKYLVNNKIEYDSEKYTCDVYNLSEFYNSPKEQIQFQDLSSGEKQIVSLFSHLYLDKSDKVFVFIDEPELSLSVEWQRSFLPDIVNSPNFVGLMATTHSPFVFDNDMEDYVHGINEFIVG